MKAMICLLFTTMFFAFTGKPYEDDVDGFWMGYYRSDLMKEKLIVHLNGADKLEFYTGGVDERTKAEGTYRMLGDSISFSYKTSEGQNITLSGHINHRKNFMDGVWRTNEKATGSFYLE